MAKKKSTSDAPQAATSLSGPDKARMHRYEVEDAMNTLMRAGEVVKNKKLMAEVKTMAKEKASEMQAVANQASHLAKMGLISEKQMDKLSK